MISRWDKLGPQTAQTATHLVAAVATPNHRIICHASRGVASKNLELENAKGQEAEPRKPKKNIEKLQTARHIQCYSAMWFFEISPLKENLKI